jgi:2'-5' RNA ligase
MRCFISIDLDKNLKNKVAEIEKKIGNLGVDVKFVEPENLHFTIKFLGEVSENEVDEIKKSLKICFKNEVHFKIKISGIGYFGNPKYLRTLWLGIKEGEMELTKLMKNVNANINFGEEERTPHLTIGRMKSGKNRQFLLHFLYENENVNIGEMDVNEVKLKLSTLTKNGPVYNDLESFKLGCENE